MTSLRQEKGMVLLLVLMIVALLASVLTEFAFSTLVDMRLTETFRDSTKAYYIAKGGLQAGRMLLQEDKRQDSLKSPPYDALNEFWAQNMITNYPVGGGFVSVQIEDLDGKLDVNSLVQTNDQPDAVVVDRFVQFFQIMGLDAPKDLVAALIDWIDKNGAVYNIQADGAEDNYYMGLAKPYHCKNAPLDSLAELAMVKGFTPKIVKLIEPFLTVHGSKKININTAPAEVIMSLSKDPVIDRSAAENIIEQRNGAPITKISDLQNVSGLSQIYIPLASLATQGYLGVTSSDFLIHSRAEVNDGARTVEAAVNRDKKQILYQKVY